MASNACHSLAWLTLWPLLILLFPSLSLHHPCWPPAFCGPAQLASGPLYLQFSLPGQPFAHRLSQFIMSLLWGTTLERPPITSSLKISPKLPIPTLMHTHPHVQTLTLSHTPIFTLASILSHTHLQTVSWTSTHKQCWNYCLSGFTFFNKPYYQLMFYFLFFYGLSFPTGNKSPQDQGLYLFGITVVSPVPKIVLNT